MVLRSLSRRPLQFRWFVGTRGNGASPAVVVIDACGFVVADAERKQSMLWTIAVILLVLWALGLITHFTIGGLIHVLLVAALVSVLFQVFRGRRAA
jgi:hypothetical protein